MRNRIYIFCLLVLMACIDPLDYSTEREEKLLVVEGFITTEPGPHTVTISLSARYGTFADGIIQRVRSAKVNVRDSDGLITEMNEVQNGIYQTPASFHAFPGKSYSLQIITQGGKRYFSLPEQAVSAIPIDTLFATYKRLPSSNPANFVSGAEIWTRFKDPSEERNYYMWQANGTYIINTHPENYFDRNTFAPAPKDCCATCWIEETYNNGVSILSDFNLDGNTVNWPVAFIEDDGGRFMEKYLVNVKQQSLTKEAYQFFNLLNNQLGISGNIFDPPPATIRGNILSIDDPDESTIGYFRVSDVSNYSIYVKRSVLEEHQKERVINDDCQILRNSFIFPPSYWE